MTQCQNEPPSETYIEFRAAKSRVAKGGGRGKNYATRQYSYRSAGESVAFGALILAIRGHLGGRFGPTTREGVTCGISPKALCMG